ncbi:hypothetical protein [Mucilaginibacter arboris]|uniref:Uncharacterized protein n=1 Tax=Mucilaginibacter arboris TaxID=2682090 RepID=A0A7K1T0M2_9SPHI|nr:hypothetical protein [Mucilaginibacter arboris]MVN22820.1 hypothetical protein [Mucilaginibacter arboris]
MEHSMIIVGIIIGLIILLIGYLANNPDTKSIDISFYQFKVMVKKNARRQSSVARKIVRRRNQLKQKARETKDASAKSA